MQVKNSNRKVLHLLHEFPPDEVFGLGQSVYSFIEESRAFMEVYVACISMQSFRNYRGNSIYPNLIRTKPEPKEDLASEWMNQNENLLAETKEELENIDLIHCHDWLLGPCALELASHYKAPLICTFHSLLSERQRMGYIEMPESLLIKALKMQEELAESSNMVLTIDAKSARILTEQYPSRNIRAIGSGIRVIEPGLDVSPGEQFRIGYLGRIAKEKGVSLIPRILKDMDRVLLHIGGNGGETDLLQKELRREGISFVYHSYVEKDEFLRNIDLLIVPSLYDPGPLVAIESVYANVPVILSTECGFSAWMEGFGGLFLARPETRAFREKIEMHMEEREQVRISLGQLRNKLLHSELNIVNFSKKLIAVYEEVLSAGG